MPSDPLDVFFAWETISSLVGGGSAIDVARLHVNSLAEAEEFLWCYGYDWGNIQHRAEIEKIRVDALHFLDREVLVDTGLSMDEEVREEQDVRRLLLACSTDAGATRQRWACTLLRLMHTFSHCYSYFNDHFGEQIRRQILDRFEPHLSLTEEGWSLGHGPMAIPLARFEFKPVKPRHSLALKLLHKAENVAADVFDRVGLRFVTRERFDAVLVVKYLTENSVVMFANTKPSRARNTLLDMGWLQQEVEGLEEEVRAGKRQRHTVLGELRQRVQATPYPCSPAPSYNPYSSLAYHSIQFTCRQMVRVANPYAGEMLIRLQRMGLSEVELRRSVSEISRGLEAQPEIRFFFPFEVQIMDERSWLLSRGGLASHAEYRARQREAVRRRVLGPLYDASSQAQAAEAEQRGEEV